MILSAGKRERRRTSNLLCFNIPALEGDISNNYIVTLSEMNNKERENEEGVPCSS